MTKFVNSLTAIAGAFAVNTAAHKLYDGEKNIYSIVWSSDNSTLNDGIGLSKFFRKDTIGHKYIYHEGVNIVNDYATSPQARLETIYYPYISDNGDSFLKVQMSILTVPSDPPVIDPEAKNCRNEHTDEYNRLVCQIDIKPDFERFIDIVVTGWTSTWEIGITYYDASSLSFQFDDVANIPRTENLKWFDNTGEFWMSSMNEETDCYYLPVSSTKYKVGFVEHEKKATFANALKYPDEPCYNSDILLTKHDQDYTLVERRPAK